MSVSFEGVKAGDRVRLTRGNGDEFTFTVNARLGTFLEDRYGNGFYRDEWDTLEVLPEPLPTGLWALVVPPVGSSYVPYVRTLDGWMVLGTSSTPSVVSEESTVQAFVRNKGFTVAFEGVEGV